MEDKESDCHEECVQPSQISHSDTQENQGLRNPRLVLSLAVPHVSSTENLSHLSKSCRTLYFACRSKLYSVATLHSFDAAMNFLWTIRSSQKSVVQGNSRSETDEDASVSGGLGKYVQVVEFRVAGLCPEAQQELESALVSTIPLFPRLSTFHWMLDLKPANGIIWRKLRSECSELRHVRLQSANGMMPRSEFWIMSNLTELRICSWTSAVDFTIFGLLHLPLIEEASYDAIDHPLTYCITVLNPHLTILELDISAPNVAFGPPNGAVTQILRSGNWPLLKEFVLGLPCSSRWICRSEHGHGYRISRTHEARMGSLIVSFLSRHPAIETLRFVRGSNSSHLPPIVVLPPEPPTIQNRTSGQTSTFPIVPSVWAPTKNRRARATSYTATRPPVFLAHKLLPDSALPNLKYFQSSSIEDLLVICRVEAHRPITHLLRVEGDIESDGMYDATWMFDEPGRLDPTGIGRPPTTVSEFSNALMGIPMLEEAMFILRGIAFRKDELVTMLMGLGPNVRELTLDAEWLGETSPGNIATGIADILGRHLGKLRLLNIDASFVPRIPEWNPEAFALSLYNTCTSLMCIRILRVDSYGRFTGYGCQEPFEMGREEYLYRCEGVVVAE